MPGYPLPDIDARLKYNRPAPVIPFLVFLIYISIPGCTGQFQGAPAAKQGVMDLSGWDFQTGGVPLDGQWEFYWNRLLTPDDFRSGPPPRRFLVLPSHWSDNKKAGISASGFATYRLVLRNVKDWERPALRINSLMGAYKIWVNREPVIENGVVGKTPSTQSQGSLTASLAPLPGIAGPLPGPVEIVVQVSRYRYVSGGPELSIVLGPEKQLSDAWDRERLSLFFACAVLLGMALYHVVFYFFRRRDLSIIFFSLYCFAWMVEMGATVCYQWAGPDLFSRVPLQLFILTSHTGYFFSVAFLMLFTRYMFPDETPTLLPRVYLAAAALLSLWIMAVPGMGRSVTAMGHFMMVTALLAWPWVIIRAVRAGRNSSRLIVLGCFVLLACGANDILHDLQVIRTTYLMYFGLLVFAGVQAFSLARRFAFAFNRAEELGEELKEKNKALSRLDALKDEFIANTTHELLTPLSGIIGLAESMTAGAAGPLSRQAVKNLDMVAASGKRLNSLVRNILDFSRLKSRDIRLNPAPVDIRGVVEGAVKLLTPLARARGLKLVNGLDRDLPPVMADENRLHQILLNLVGNALKYTPEGQITISAGPRDGMMRISVRDTGIGIPEAMRDKVFLRFEQVRSDTAQKFEGTGLGLSITKHLVELHRGTVGFDSVEGRGATFYFTLPLAGPDVTLPAPAPEAGPSCSEVPGLHLPDGLPEPLPVRSPAKGDRTLILVVDDDPVNIQVAVNHLSVAGYDTATARSGKQALAMLPAGSRPALVLLDVMMPEMDGYEVCRTLRETHSMSGLPVIMLTARNRTRDIVKGFEAGANDYLTKPFSREELTARVEAQLKLKRAYKVLRENSRLKKELRDLMQARAGRLEKPGTGSDASPGKALPGGDTDRIQLGVDVMNRALGLWTYETGAAKADLAEQSGIWKVYASPNGFRRTQTLDRYLSTGKFPKRPRWHQVFQTVEYVLLSCDRDSERKTALRTAYSDLKTLI